jgi:hypothetical protein
MALCFVYLTGFLGLVKKFWIVSTPDCEIWP